MSLDIDDKLLAEAMRAGGFQDEEGNGRSWITNVDCGKGPVIASEGRTSQVTSVIAVDDKEDCRSRMCRAILLPYRNEAERGVRK